jgi:hypothetical protein
VVFAVCPSEQLPRRARRAARSVHTVAMVTTTSRVRYNPQAGKGRG